MWKTTWTPTAWIPPLRRSGSNRGGTPFHRQRGPLRLCWHRPHVGYRLGRIDSVLVKLYSSCAVKYRVREPLLAILKEPVSCVTFLTIKRGSIITVKGDQQAYGFVEVDYDGQTVLAFRRGIELRADRVRGTGY